MRKRHWGILAAVVVVLGAAVVAWTLRREQKPESPYRTEAVQRGDVVVQVSATGTLNAVTTVQVGSQVSGTISALHADFNDRVHKNEVLAQLDPTFLRAQVAQNEADLERTRVEVRQAERNYARLAPMRDQGLASQADIDASETAVEAARASEKSSVAALDRARTNLHYATITSPIDGIVISRNVDVGQTVAASLSAPTLFTIANDLTRMQLEAAVDEADIGMIQVDQKVKFTVDAFPERTFNGAVHQIRLAPQTVQNVVSYTVIVLVENPDQVLLPGMTANATFLVDEARGVLRVPSAALRFRPAPKAGAARSAGAGSAVPPVGQPGGQRPGGMRGGPGIFILAENGQLHRVQVTPGLSDGTFTAVTADSLQEGMLVVIAATNGSAAGAAQGQVNPFVPGGMNRGRR
jgi:HlyD family secretion protein